MFKVSQALLKPATFLIFAISIYMTIGFAHSGEPENPFDFEAYRTAPQARLPHGQMPVSGSASYVPVRDPRCPRLDVIAVGKNVTALNVNGHTLGHMRGLMLNRRGGDLSRFDSGQLAFYPKNPHDEGVTTGVAVSPIDCVRTTATVPFSVNGDTKRLLINDRFIGNFDSFALSAQNHDLIRQGRRLVLPRMPEINIAPMTKSNQISANASGSKLEDFRMPSIPGSIGAGSGGTPRIGGSGYKPPKQPRCTPGQGKHCAE